MKNGENNYQRIKLLKIIEILRETDEDHALNNEGHLREAPGNRDLL